MDSTWGGIVGRYGYIREGNRIILGEPLYQGTHQGVGNQKTSVLVSPAWGSTGQPAMLGWYSGMGVGY